MSGVAFPCWVAWNGDGRPVGFGNANYLSGEEFREDFPVEQGYTIRLVTDQAERDELLAAHSKGTT